MRHSSLGRDISVTQTSSFENYVFPVGNNFARHSQLNFQRQVHNNKPSCLRVHFDGAGSVAETKPAASNRAFLDHHTLNHDLRRYVTRSDGDDTVPFARWRFAQDFSIRFAATPSQEEQNQERDVEPHEEN